VKYVDEFRDPAAAKILLTRIEHLASRLTKPLAVMEICGGHTHTIYRHGLEHLLPTSIELIHGPGCPVCVIPMGRVDDAMWLARRPNVILTTFGDMMRVPGSTGDSLLNVRAGGADIRFVYSPLDALAIAKDNPDKEVVFFAVGFETTAPSTAVTLEAARLQQVPNFSVFSNHVTIEPPLRAIVNGGETRVDGFIGPGHVATVVGTTAFEFLPAEYNLPVVVTGFEPLDILQAVEMLLTQFVSGEVAAGRARVENQYARVVRTEGNKAALELMERTFSLRETFEWRGLGWIERSGFGIAPEYAAWDAERKFAVPGVRVADPQACECGSVLTGRLKPWECKVFGTACTPDSPIGTCMVSPEGACAAYYTFGRIDRDVAQAVVIQD
jgi:hydrogenase expression/formation protein HypD